MGAEPPAEGPAQRDDVVRTAHDGGREPGVDRLLHDGRARGRAHAARHDLRRDVGVGEHLPAAARPPGPRRRPAHRAVLDLQPRQGAERAVLGPDRPHDAEGRRASVPRRGRPASRRQTWCCACCEWRSRRRPSADGEGPEAPRRDGNALALLRAVGGFQAFMRAAAAPPNAGPVSRFMLYEREFPDSVAASIESLGAALERVEGEPQDSPPVLRVRRMLADLDFRARVSPGGGHGHADAPAAPAGARAARRRDRRTLLPSKLRGNSDSHRMRFALRYQTEYRYGGHVFDQHNSLRVTPATARTSASAASA